MDDARPRLRRSTGDEMLERDFGSAADQVLADGETDDEVEIEADGFGAHPTDGCEPVELCESPLIF